MKGSYGLRPRVSMGRRNERPPQLPGVGGPNLKPDLPGGRGGSVIVPGIPLPGLLRSHGYTGSDTGTE